MGLDAEILVKFKDNTPEKIYNLFNYKKNADGEYVDKYEIGPVTAAELDGNYYSAGYYRSFWNLQDYMKYNMINQIDDWGQLIRLSEDEIKNLYFDIWRANSYEDEDECYPITLEDLDTYNIESDLNKILNNSKYIEDYVYLGSF